MRKIAIPEYSTGLPVARHDPGEKSVLTNFSPGSCLRSLSLCWCNQRHTSFFLSQDTQCEYRPDDTCDEYNDQHRQQPPGEIMEIDQERAPGFVGVQERSTKQD